MVGRPGPFRTRFNSQSIACITTSECTAVGGSSNLKTTDGTSWNPQIAPAGLDSLSSVSCPGVNTCLAVGFANSVPSIVGTQDGTTWTTLEQPAASSLSSISCAKATNCVASGIALGGGGTSLRTVDLSTWTAPTLIPTGTQLNSLACPIETTCIAVGTNLSSTPYVVGTSNNGSTWSSQSAPSNAIDLTGISCATAVDCIAVGNSGNTGAGSTIMGTTTGGLSWVVQNPPPGASRLNADLMSEQSQLFRCWNQHGPGLVNAGYAWNPEVIPTQVSGLNGISCATTSDCTAVGFGIFGSPVAIGTTDGGRTWTAETVPAGVGVLTASFMCQRIHLLRRE